MAGLEQDPSEPTAWVVGGSLMLADIYYNGAGVKRHIPLALRFACESEEGMAQLAVEYLNEGKVSPHEPFEFCDYAMTTMTMNFCASSSFQIDDDRRDRYYRSLKSSMNPEQQAAFGKLLSAEGAYIAAHALEVDQGGTIRGLRTMGSENILKDLFHTEILHFERKKCPALSENQIASADGVLSREYKKKLEQLRAYTSEEINEGAVTANHLSSVEKAWENYRNAWVAFARVRYPAATSSIRAEITLDRYRFLKTI